MLYKYFRPENFDFVFTDSGVSLRGSQASSLNDPFELNFTQDHILDELEKMISQVKRNVSSEKLYNFYLKEKRNEASENLKLRFESFYDYNFGVISVSSNKNSRPMWSYYSKDHTGFMISFKTKKKDNHLRVQDYDFFKVKYKKDRPKAPFGEQATQEDVEKLFTKDSAWRHELEYRAIADLKKINSLSTDERGYSIKCVTFKPETIAYIVLGARSEASLERRIKNWITTISPKTKLFQAKPSQSRYELEYIEVKFE